MGQLWLDIWWIPGISGRFYAEDTEVIFVHIGTLMVTGFLLFGAGGYLVYRKIQKSEERNSLHKEGMNGAVNALTAEPGELNRRQDAALEQNTDSWIWFWNRVVNNLWFWNSLVGWIRTWRSFKLGSVRTVHKFSCLDFLPLRWTRETLKADGKSPESAWPKQLLYLNWFLCVGLGRPVISISPEYYANGCSSPLALPLPSDTCGDWIQGQ